jgi:tetratricopeptide (TPR) repeat protein
MRAYQQACGEVLKRYEGHVAQYLGDGLVVYFGWPRAHEDDAQRAARAGLEIIEAVKNAQVREPIKVRIGIATGSVVVGETGAGDASVPKLAVGETPNLAARLQGLADPDSVVIAAATHRLLGSAFDYQDLGEHILKGIAKPVHAWRVVRVRRMGGRFEAAHEAAVLTPFVGRESELALLLEHWQQAKIGNGRVVLVSGEAGVGKSRCVQMLRERIASERYSCLRYQGSPFHSSSALYPFIDELERAAGIGREDPPATKLDKLCALLEESNTDATDAIPLLAALLYIPTDRRPPPRYSPQELKERTIEVLVGYVVRLARSQPVLLVVEDAHWVDPTSLETLDALVAQVATAAVLMLVSFRPEFAPRWTARPHVTALPLSRLSRGESATMTRTVTGGKALPARVLDHIVARTDGVPLFVEELTKAVLESKLLRDAGDRYELAGPLEEVAIPATLHDSLMARLDRLASVLDVAQLAACIGREFGYELLAAFSPLSGRDLRSALDRLVESELLFARGHGSKAVYRFKHALVQDAAYGSILRSRRQELHATIAGRLETDFPEIAATEPELLGLHYERGAMPDDAVKCYLRAGQLAKARSANREAIHSFERALSLLDHTQDATRRGLLEIDLRSDLGMLHLVLEGATSAAARSYLGRAHEMGVGTSTHQRFPALVGMVEVLTWETRMGEARQLGEELLRLAQDVGDRVHALYAWQVHARSIMWMGRFREALTESQRVTEIYDEQIDSRLAFQYGYDPAVSALSTIAYMYRELGYLDRAAKSTDECIGLARRIGHPHTLSFALSTPGADIWYLMREPDKVLQFAREGEEVSARGAFEYQRAVCEMHAGWATAMQGRHDEGIEVMHRALRAIREIGVRAMMAPRMTAQLASVYAAAGRADEGLEVLASSPDRQLGQRRVRYSEIYRIEGDLHSLKSSPDLALAEACYKEAMEVAIQDEARTFELRSATSLARLWQSQGRHSEAYALLAPIYTWFSEGFGFRDLREAAALLDALKR